MSGKFKGLRARNIFFTVVLVLDLIDQLSLLIPNLSYHGHKLDECVRAMY